IEQELAEKVEEEDSRVAYEKLDEEIVDVVTDELRTGPLPDVLSVYLSGADSYAHVAKKGPDAARREYLHDVMDPLIGKLADRLRERGALENRFVVVTADHGHTEVRHDDVHALSMTGEHEPPALLAKTGFRVRPFEIQVSPNADFQAV